MTHARTLEAALRAAGLPPGSVVLAPEPTPDVPRPPEGPWVIVPHGAQFLVGGVGRGRFAAYEALWTFDDAVSLAVRLAATPVGEPIDGGDGPSAVEERGDGAEATASSPAALIDRGRATADAIRERTERRDGSPGPHGLVVGDVLDCVGPETGHHLYALGTPFPARSQPPSDIGAPYSRYEVRVPLPADVREGVAAPWFGQPGGGAMVVLARPVRWYVDQGFLAVLV
ncbi:TNT domain-containing protein [Georgenia faecalis]|uniref:TNT domain-containing protein n=1 Tax=Georgenia faecalis TaxID=2483799 RepID=A0ABV9DA99_9MICO|nr:TNT domain-containing protein [Georgenia faecalis]